MDLECPKARSVTHYELLRNTYLQKRAKLIQELRQTRQEDDQNEQKMLNDLAWSRSAAPANTEQFDQREEQIDSVVKDLEIGTPVHWSVIKQALVVPTSPY